MIYLSSENIFFPDVSFARHDGLLAVGGDLSTERLLEAYRNGIFPWYDDNQPILWWSPDPRMVMFPKKLKVSKSLRKIINSKQFEVTFNESFSEVIRHCAAVKRKDQGGTWITDDMIEAYQTLHDMGVAKSVEVWSQGNLVGGLYGIDLADERIFCGESMFSLESNASKVALYHLVQKLLGKEYRLIDCQMYTPHLQSLGAEEMPRNEFISILKGS